MPPSSLPLAALAALGATVAALGAPVVAPAAPPPASGSGSASDRPAAVAGRWSWPLDPQPRVLRGFDDVSRYAAGHRGVDLSAQDSQQVLAPADGTVAFAGPVAGRGVLVLAHADGLRSSYEPVTATAPVGTVVRAGDVVATLAAGPAHCAGPCLHLGLRRGEDYLDPLGWLRRARPPVLLPLGRAG